MFFYFVLFYFIGALIYFCHTGILTIIVMESLASRIHLDEKEREKIVVNFFSKVLFQTLMMAVFPGAFGIYIIIYNRLGNVFFVSSGLFTIVWLFCTGMLIKVVYYFLGNKIELLKGLNCYNYFHDVEIFWVTCPLLYGILFSLYDGKLFFIILAIVLGKYIWMDSFRMISLKDIIVKVKVFFKKHKIDIILLVCQLVIMGYLLIRCHKMDNELINMGYILNTFIICAVFLLPSIDLFIISSMILYIKDMQKKFDG